MPNKFLEDWEFEGKKSHFSDRFSGYSVFVSRRQCGLQDQPLRSPNCSAKEMKAQGLQYAEQYTQAIMGRYRHPLLNKETGVYSYDELIVLRKTRMPAVLLEAGSIINRDEELKMDSPERRDIISSGVAAAVKEFCDPRWGMLGPLLMVTPQLIRAGLVLTNAAACAGLGRLACPGVSFILRDIDPTIVQDIRYAGSHNFVGRPIRGYLAAECILSAAGRKCACARAEEAGREKALAHRLGLLSAEAGGR